MFSFSSQYLPLLGHNSMVDLQTSVFLDYMGCYNFLMTGYVIYNAEGVNPLVINTLFELPEVKGTFFYLVVRVLGVFLQCFFLCLCFVGFFFPTKTFVTCFIWKLLWDNLRSGEERSIFFSLGIQVSLQWIGSPEIFHSWKKHSQKHREEGISYLVSKWLDTYLCLTHSKLFWRDLLKTRVSLCVCIYICIKPPICIHKHTCFKMYKYIWLAFQVIWRYSRDSCPAAVSQLLCFQNCGAILKAFNSSTDCVCTEVALTLIVKAFL